MKVGNFDRDVVYAYGTAAFLLRPRLRDSRQCGKGKNKLTAGQFATLELVQHRFYGLYHKVSALVSFCQPR